MFYYEYKYVSELISVDSRLKHYFRYCSRDIDDLCKPQGMDEFDTVCKEIYPECMILEKTNICRKKATFLDLDIIIYYVNENQFFTQLYDKRSMPNLKSNVPERR